MSLLSRLGRMLKAEMGRRLPNIDPFDVSGHETPEGASYNAETGTTNDAHVQEPHGDYRIAAYYAALELPFGADITAVKQAHRRLMKRYHPDRFHADPDKAETANEVTRRLNEAYDGLRQYLEANP